MAKKYGELKNYDIIFEGILKKSPPQKTKAFFNFITKRWKKRYFVLYKTLRPNQAYMLYFKVDPSLECKNIGDIDLVKLTNLSANVGSSVNRSNVFSIQTSDEKGDNRVYFLCAPSFELMNSWVEKLVTCLHLNGNNSLYNSVTTLASPLPHSRTRSTQRVSRNYISSPKPNSPLVSYNSLSETPRLSLVSSMERSNDTTDSSYYNLSPGKNSFFQEHLEDPMSADDDETYKCPYDSSNQHAYVNLDDEEPTPSAIKTDLSGDLFFSNDDNLFNYSNIGISVDNPSSNAVQPNVGDNESEYQNLPANHFVNQLSNVSSEIRSIEEDKYDFDFALPTRVRSQSASSSSSSNSSSSNDGVFKNNFVSKTEVSDQRCLANNVSPPLVPKRLNITDTNKKSITTETVLPIKTPKTIQIKTDSSDMNMSFTDDTFSSLNYLDADNLLLGNRHDIKLESSRESHYASLDVIPNHYNNCPLSPFESKGPDFNSTRSDTPSNIDDCLQSSMFTLTASHKDSLPSVEYREICNTRTEALLKLHVRIQKK